MTKPVSYKRHRFPPQIIAHAVWLYFRFPLSLRLVEAGIRAELGSRTLLEVRIGSVSEIPVS
jgi:transposase-like protein